MGLACISTDAPGCNESVIDAHTGLLCALKDSADLARKIEILLDDEQKTAIFGANARKLVLQNYDQPIITQKYLQVYGEFFDV